MMRLLDLTPRQTKTALDLFTGAVVLSVAFALAGLTWRIAGHAGTGAITVPSGTSAPAVSTDIAPALALAPFGKPSASEASQQTALPLVLRGVVAAIPASLSTAFISVSGEAAAPFKVGASVGGATIEGILRDRVILNNAGRIEYLPFPDPTLSPGQRAESAAAAPAAPAPPGAPAAAQPPTSAPSAGPQSTTSLLQRFNATPTDGGYRIGANAPPGMQAGDVLVSLNGASATDQSAVAAAYSAAQQSGSATLQILRDGKRMTLTVPVR